MNCRFCGTKLETKFVDLGMQPASNNYISKKNIYSKEIFYPLITYVCENCFLVQTLDTQKSDELFTSDYAYFSSYSSSWLTHAKKYVYDITEKLTLDETSTVMEIASNDGYLLQFFKKKNIKCFGVEPCESVAKAAIEKGIETKVEFFTENYARTLEKSDLIIGNNVLAHVPDINDFVKGLSICLKENGTATLEFPSLLNLINLNQFDTIYHEHYSYLSLLFVKKLLEFHNLDLYDVENLSTHGGSLRIYVSHRSQKSISSNVVNLLEQEKELLDIKTYSDYSENVKKTKRDFLSLLIKLKNENSSIVSYGAAAKGNTLFNYCGIKTDIIDYAVDNNPHKQNKLLPGSRIEIKSPTEIKNTRPNYIIITPWNLKDEIIEQLSYTREWGCKFIIAISNPCIL